VLIAFQGVAADEFGEAIGLVCIRSTYRAHLIDTDLRASLGKLPGSFRPGQAAASDDDIHSQLNSRP